jgi:hypothetical protein
MTYSETSEGSAHPTLLLSRRGFESRAQPYKARDESVPIPLTGLDEGGAEHGDEAKEEDDKEFA